MTWGSLFVAACVGVEVVAIYVVVTWVVDMLVGRARDKRIMRDYLDYRTRDAFSRRVSMDNKRRGMERTLGRGPR